MDERNEKEKDNLQSLGSRDGYDDDDKGFRGDDSKYQGQTLANNYLTVINTSASIIDAEDHAYDQHYERT